MKHYINHRNLNSQLDSKVLRYIAGTDLCVLVDCRGYGTKRCYIYVHFMKDGIIQYTTFPEDYLRIEAIKYNAEDLYSQFYQKYKLVRPLEFITIQELEVDS